MALPLALPALGGFLTEAFPLVAGGLLTVEELIRREREEKTPRYLEPDYEFPKGEWPPAAIPLRGNPPPKPGTKPKTGVRRPQALPINPESLPKAPSFPLPPPIEPGRRSPLPPSHTPEQYRDPTGRDVAPGWVPRTAPWPVQDARVGFAAYRWTTLWRHFSGYQFTASTFANSGPVLSIRQPNFVGTNSLDYYDGILWKPCDTDTLFKVDGYIAVSHTNFVCVDRCGGIMAPTGAPSNDRPFRTAPPVAPPPPITEPETVPNPVIPSPFLPPGFFPYQPFPLPARPPDAPDEPDSPETEPEKEPEEPFPLPEPLPDQPDPANPKKKPLSPPAFPGTSPATIPSVPQTLPPPAEPSRGPDPVPKPPTTPDPEPDPPPTPEEPDPDLKPPPFPNPLPDIDPFPNTRPDPEIAPDPSNPIPYPPPYPGTDPTKADPSPHPFPLPKPIPTDDPDFEPDPIPGPLPGFNPDPFRDPIKEFEPYTPFTPSPYPGPYPSPGPNPSPSRYPSPSTDPWNPPPPPNFPPPPYSPPGGLPPDEPPFVPPLDFIVDPPNTPPPFIPPNDMQSPFYPPEYIPTSPPPPGGGQCKDDKCTISIEQKAGDAAKASKDGLNKLERFLERIEPTLQVLDVSLLAIINEKLGPQVEGGISGKLEGMEKILKTVAGTVAGIAGKLGRVASWLHLDRALNVLTFATTVHNAAMLSRDLGQTLFMAISNVLAVIGIKDDEGSPLDISKIIGDTVENLLKGVLGTANYTALTAAWKNANRIYQASANLLSSIQSLRFSVVGALETIGGWNARIGNALRKWGTVGESAYSWMNPSPDFDNKFTTAIQNAQNAVSSIDSVASEVLSAQETVTEITKQSTELKNSLGLGTEKPETENKPQKDKATASKTVSASPDISSDDLKKPGGV